MVKVFSTKPIRLISRVEKKIMKRIFLILLIGYTSLGLVNEKDLQDSGNQDGEHGYGGKQQQIKEVAGSQHAPAGDYRASHPNNQKRGNLR